MQVYVERDAKEHIYFIDCILLIQMNQKKISESLL